METRKTSSKKDNKEYRRNINRTESLLGGIICQENSSEVLLVGTTLVKTHIVKRMIQPTSMESINGNNNDINYEDLILETPLANNVNNNANRNQVKRSPEVPNTTCHLEKGEISGKKEPGGLSKKLSKPNSDVKVSPRVNSSMDKKEIYQEPSNTKKSKDRGIDVKKQNCFQNVHYLTNSICDTNFKREISSGQNDIADLDEGFLSRNKRKSTQPLAASSYGNNVISGKVQDLVKFFETLNTKKRKIYKEGNCTSVENEAPKSLAIACNVGSSNEKTKSVENDSCESSQENSQFTPHMTQLSIGLKNGELMYEILKDINNRNSILESSPDKKEQRPMKSYELTKPNSSPNLMVSEKIMPSRGHQLPKLEVVVNRGSINGMSGSTSARMVNKSVSKNYSGYLSGVRDKPPKRRFTWRFLGYVVCALAFLFSSNLFQGH